MKLFIKLLISLSVQIIFAITIHISVVAQNQNAYPLSGTLWGNKRISVCWDNPEPWNARFRDLVREAVTETWQKYSSLEFVNWGTSNQNDADIHILISDEGPHTKGLGTELKGKKNGMVLNFTFNNWCPNCKSELEKNIKAIAVHEFGHALGFAHEHNRADCRFENCMKEPQGKNGNWYITPCDLFSVMNYCNPNYNNNGKLSDNDKFAVQKLYGYPISQLKDHDGFRGLELVHSSQYEGQTGKRRNRTDWYNLKIYLSGNSKELDKIDYVKYKLHETFDDPIVDSDDRESNFGLSITVWGQFDLYATVYYKDGKTKNLKHYLSF